MRIDAVHCDAETELHIWSRHRVTVQEVEDAVYRRGLILRGRSDGLYGIFGRTDAGRYLMLVVRYLGDSMAQLITARDMSWTERRRYEKHTAH